MEKAWALNRLKLYAKIFYYQRTAAEKKSGIIEESIELLSLLIRITESRIAFNQSGTVYRFKASARLEDLRNMLLMEKSVIAESNIGINTLMSRSLSEKFRIDTALTGLLGSEPSYSDSLPEQRSDIAAVSAGIESMKKNITLMRLQRKPDYGIRASHMQMAGMPEQFSLMGMVTIPIVPWSAKMYRSEIRSMQFQVSAMEKEKETMRLMAKQHAAEKQAMLEYKNKQLKNLVEKIIPAYEKSFEQLLIAYRQNTADLYVVLDAWEMVLMKKTEYYNLANRIAVLIAELEYEIEKK